MLKWLKTMEGTRQLKVDIYIETHANKDSRKASDRISEGYIAQIREQNGFDEVGSTARQMSLRFQYLLKELDGDFDIPTVEDFDYCFPDENPVLKVGEEKEIGDQG